MRHRITEGRNQRMMCGKARFSVVLTTKEIEMRIVKAAAVQFSPVLYSREGTVEKVVRKIHELGRQGVQFATFPETVVPYYSYFSLVQPPTRLSSDLST
jgi:nitrilase